MEMGTIERELHIDAAPEVVYEVISSPEHMREWWPDDADLDPVPGATGTITFHTDAADIVETVTVVEADPPRRFSFRWIEHEGGSLLVTFDLSPTATGTRVRFSETGFREKGWEAAVLEQQYREHETGWDHFLPRLVTLAEARGEAA